MRIPLLKVRVAFLTADIVGLIIHVVLLMWYSHSVTQAYQRP